MRKGFDNQKYIDRQSTHILERIGKFGDKLYLEFGGKLFDDYHASRVLPGYDKNNKVKLLQTMKDKVEILIAVNAKDIEKNKMRSDIGISYSMDVLRLIDVFRGLDLYVGSVVVTQFKGQQSAEDFKNKLKDNGIAVYTHYPIEGYPTNVARIVSEDGFGKNEYIETTRPLVVVTAPGPGSGKMATCLSQLYHEHKRGIEAGYAKFETFPIWNLPLKHPVNIAYEAATTDLDDDNMIDPFHLEAYGETAINYNRDIEIFPVLDTILTKIYGKNVYKSPTDMGVNMAGFGIVDDDACKEASKQEIIRRYYKLLEQIKKGENRGHEVDKMELIMSQAAVDPSIRKCVKAARDKSKAEGGKPVVAIELNNGIMVTGKEIDILCASATSILNAIKELGEIADNIHLIRARTIRPIQRLKEMMGVDDKLLLNSNEALTALASSAFYSDEAEKGLEQLSKLRGSNAHSTVMLSGVDVEVFMKLGVNITCDPEYRSEKLYHK